MVYEGENGDVVDFPIGELNSKRYQEWLVRLPVRAGGLGLRSITDISPAALIGGVEMSLPFFGGSNGICKVLEETVGDMSMFDKDNRW